MLLIAVMLLPTLVAASTTVVMSTTTYNGVTDTNAPIAAALPIYGPYIFTMTVIPSPSTATLTSFNAYLQQKGLSGSLYTIANSTFTSCSGTCNLTVAPDIYMGGTIVPRWTVANGSATVIFSAISLTP